MCLEKKKCCFNRFDKEINLLPVNRRLSVFSVKLEVSHWTVEGNKEKLVQLHLKDTPTFTCCMVTKSAATKCVCVCV